MLNKRLFAFPMIMIMLLTYFGIIPCGASSGGCELYIATQKWDEKLQSNIASDVFSTGDIITVCISVDSISSLGGLDFTLKYPAELKYTADSALCLITDAKGDSTYKSGESYVRVLYDTSSRTTAVSGTIFTFRFSVKNDCEANAQFSLIVNELYDGSAQHKDITVNNGTPCNKQIALVKFSVPQELLDIIGKLQTITLDSLPDIVVAENAFNSLTALQKETFPSLYPDYYNNLSCARTKFYNLQDSANKAQIKAFADAFIKSNEILLAKNVSDLSLNDVEAVNALINQYDALNATVKSNISADIKKKIESFSSAADDLLEAKDFIENENYTDYLNIPLKTLKEDAEGALTIATEVQLAYSILSEGAKEFLAAGTAFGDSYSDLPTPVKSFLTSKGKQLDDIVEELKSQINVNEQEEAITNEVIAFQKTWIKVLTLTKGRVSVADKTALELCIAAGDSLSSGAKERLASKFDTLKELLKMASSLNVTKNEAGEAVRTEIKTVTQNVPGATQTITNTNTVTEQKTVKQQLSKIFWWLLILLGVSVMTVPYPVIRYCKFVKSHNQTVQESEEYPE